ncbi:MAG: nicotinate phosphoribosyltransferase [Candidatus Methanomethylicota archaeon]|jgi:nicotinate phosphoribosyltransferase|uniref:nicotinate phosphoribosyltransferase n=1 Tax=Thermoproteota archaeon TaxID=2056631 RepID=A0A523BF77_9CREN|nr:MAG: nicotinate phosphoribosyltransferase [Candidatus Verstraetearchaeota archaeon]TDA39597.1 MAG: nicotinate phosphoribosyltransferase [Candidatus Verstraetearchaeota archaeon]
MRRFHIANDEEIKSGLTSDIYYIRTKEILEKKNMDKEVTAEITTGKLPRNWKWAVFCGLEELLYLYEGIPVDVYSIPEGTIFTSKDIEGIRIPLVEIIGKYTNFVSIETATLGFLCQASGVATAAARVRKAAKNKEVFAFGIRRMHPGISPMLDRAAYIGGFNGVSGILGAKIIGEKPVGTMPHPLILIFGDQVSAWKAFDEVIDPSVPRIVLVDTLWDEKYEAIMAAENLRDKLYGIRLDTPGSRKGDLLEIIKEVRWELDIRGYKHVKIYVSGGLDDEIVAELANGPVDGFGVGTYVSNAPTIDFSMDIVEVEGRPVAKRGKYSGRKKAWRCENCYRWKVTLFDQNIDKCPLCGGEMVPMLKKYIEKGKIIEDIKKPKEIREYVLKQLEYYTLE